MICEANDDAATCEACWEICHDLRKKKKLLCYETDTDIIAFGIRKILRGRVRFPTGGDEAKLTSPRLPKGTDMV